MIGAVGRGPAAPLRHASVGACRGFISSSVIARRRLAAAFASFARALVCIASIRRPPCSHGGILFVPRYAASPASSASVQVRRFMSWSPVPGRPVLVALAASPVRLWAVQGSSLPAAHSARSGTRRVACADLAPLAPVGLGLEAWADLATVGRLSKGSRSLHLACAGIGPAWAVAALACGRPGQAQRRPAQPAARFISRTHTDSGGHRAL